MFLESFCFVSVFKKRQPEVMRSPMGLTKSVPNIKSFWLSRLSHFKMWNFGLQQKVLLDQSGLNLIGLNSGASITCLNREGLQVCLIYGTIKKTNIFISKSLICFPICKYKVEDNIMLSVTCHHRQTEAVE